MAAMRTARECNRMSFFFWKGEIHILQHVDVGTGCWRWIKMLLEKKRSRSGWIQSIQSRNDKAQEMRASGKKVLSKLKTIPTDRKKSNRRKRRGAISTNKRAHRWMVRRRQSKKMSKQENGFLRRRSPRSSQQQPTSERLSKYFYYYDSVDRLISSFHLDGPRSVVKETKKSNLNNPRDAFDWWWLVWLGLVEHTGAWPGRLRHAVKVHLKLSVSYKWMNFN